MTDVDDERLGALFRAAASDSAAPPPGFDHEAVVRASRRITARRRAAVVVGGFVLVALVGVGGAISLPGSRGAGGDAATVAAPMLAPPADSRAQEQARPPAAPDAAPGAAPNPRAAPAAPEAATVGEPPLGPGTTACADRQDPALRAIVEEYLPEVIGAPEAAIGMECRPRGERGTNLEVRDGAATGVLTVQYLPPAAQPEPVEGAVVAPTASGGTVLVSSRAESDARAPFADRLVGLATHLSPRL